MLRKGRGQPMSRIALALLPLAIGMACPQPEAEPTEQATDVVFRYELDDKPIEETSFYSTPWPSDHRRLDSGQPALGNFPLGYVSSLVRTYIETYERDVDGFSAMPIVYFEIEQADVTLSLPTARSSLDDDASVFMVALDAHCGERVPVEVVERHALDSFLPAHFLAVAAVPGFVLRPQQRYAVVVSEEITPGRGTASEDFENAYDSASGNDRLDDGFAALRDCRQAMGADWQAVVATVFTTQDPVGETRDRVRHVEADSFAINDVTDWTLNNASTKDGEYTTYTGRIAMPIFQSGNSPYSKDGGFTVDDGGQPEIHGYEDVPIVLTFPVGDGPFPVFIWQSGAGASLRGHIRQSYAQRFLEEGFAVAKFEPQFHGERATPGSDLDFHTHNYLNPEAGRTVYRQQVIDAAVFIRVVREKLPLLDGVPELNTERVIMGGHSQGAEATAMLAGVSKNLDAILLNGVGTYVAETIVHRTNPFDVAQIFQTLFDVQERPDRFHPLIHLVQMGADVVDPGNYLRFWNGHEDRPTGVHALVINGFHDQDVYYRSMDALTLGADLDVVEPAGWDIDPFDVGDREGIALPLAPNRTAHSGDPRLAATFLSPDYDHFTLYDFAPSRDLAAGYLHSLVDDEQPSLPDVDLTSDL